MYRLIDTWRYFFIFYFFKTLRIFGILLANVTKHCILANKALSTMYTKLKILLKQYGEVANCFMSTVVRRETVAENGLASLSFFMLQSYSLLYELTQYSELYVVS